MRVNVQCDAQVKFFDKVTKVETFLAFDMFGDKIKIYQGKKVTTFKECEINGFEVLEGERC